MEISFNSHQYSDVVNAGRRQNGEISVAPQSSGGDHLTASIYLDGKNEVVTFKIDTDRVKAASNWRDVPELYALYETVNDRLVSLQEKIDHYFEKLSLKEVCSKEQQIHKLVTCCRQFKSDFPDSFSLVEQLVMNPSLANEVSFQEKQTLFSGHWEKLRSMLPPNSIQLREKISLGEEHYVLYFGIHTSFMTFQQFGYFDFVPESEDYDITKRITRLAIRTSFFWRLLSGRPVRNK